MRISLDFEGVLAQPWNDAELAGLDVDTLQRSALSVAGEPPRFGARSLVSLLAALASIEIVTSRPAATVPAIRAWLREHLPGLEAVPVHAGPLASRAALLRTLGVELHIDHRPLPQSAGDDVAAPRCLLWPAEPVEALLGRVVTILTRRADLHLSGHAVTAIAELPCFSSTPVYRVDTAAGSFKLRLVEPAGQSALLRQLHQLATAHPSLATLLPPELPGLPVFVHAVPFFSGTMVEVHPPRDGADLVARVARWQAELHDRTLQPDGTSLVVCACDAFNLCVADDGAAAIVDAADCLLAPRWLDLVWTERLLCPWTGGAERYLETYFASTDARPTRAEVAEALAGYYYRHQSIIRHSLLRRRADPAVVTMLAKVKGWRAATPTTSLLERYAV